MGVKNKVKNKTFPNSKNPKSLSSVSSIMGIETAPIINDRDRSRVWESPRKKPKTDYTGKSTEKETTTNVNNVDEEQISDDDDGDWIDEETVQIMIEKLNKKYDDFAFIDDENLRVAARAYRQRLNDNPFDIDDLPPPPIPDYFDTIGPLDQQSCSWLWERANELLHYAVETEQEKKGWNLSDLNLVKANKAQSHYFITFEAKHDQENITYQTTVCDNVIPSGYGSIDVKIFKRKGEEAPAAMIGHN